MIDMGRLSPEGRKQSMMGYRRFAPKLYYQLSLDHLVPQNHLLRRIAEVMDFSFVYPMARPYYSHTGQPSVDPVVLFKALLIGYLYGVTSERRLMEEIQVNLAYRWFLGYDLDEAVPGHSVLSKARVRFGMEVFETFFNRTVGLCQQAGLVRGEATFVDSTLIQANAALRSLKPTTAHRPLRPRRSPGWPSLGHQEVRGNNRPGSPLPGSSSA
jgi:transposase